MKEYITLKGKQEVGGSLRPSGSKNASLALICASLLVKGRVILHHVPRIDDIFYLFDILKYLNCKVDFDGDKVEIDSSFLTYKPLCIPEVSKIRASYYLIGALLGNNTSLDISYPGGCSFSSRPIDMHIEVFSSLGVKVDEADHLHFSYDKLCNGDINLKKKSLGTTVNAILLMCQIEGESVLRGISEEPEIDDLIAFINEAGGSIVKENDTLIIQGRKNYHPLSFFISYDRIEIGSYALLGAALGRILIQGVNKEQNQYLFSLMDELKIKYSYVSSLLCVEKSDLSYKGKIICSSFPSFPTDLKASLCALLLLNKQEVVIEDDVYPSRNQFVDEMIKLGGEIRKEEGKIYISYSPFLNGTSIEASDLRASFGLLIAGLISKGVTKINNFSLSHRGYQDIYLKLRQLNIEFEVNYN
ncbi:MAG: UDP-N-acetylglucosamine 1-carboxyvinyltransferase [Bacilli bacterium]